MSTNFLPRNSVSVTRFFESSSIKGFLSAERNPVRRRKENYTQRLRNPVRREKKNTRSDSATTANDVDEKDDSEKSGADSESSHSPRRAAHALLSCLPDVTAPSRAWAGQKEQKKKKKKTTVVELPLSSALFARSFGRHVPQALCTLFESWQSERKIARSAAARAEEKKKR